MNIIYSNDYGTCYKVSNSPHPNCVVQMVVGVVGIFMSMEDLNHLLNVIKEPPPPCDCNQCEGMECNKIWCHGPLLDFYIKVNDETRDQLKELIGGTMFILEFEKTLTALNIN